MTKLISFTDDVIQDIFGHEAAEDERPERLREYYFKTSVYENVTTILPLRILVGHKGVGKSALFRVAYQEDAEKGILPIVIKPDDILDISPKDDDFNKIIREWKSGLIKVMAKKVLSNLGTEPEGWTQRIGNYGGNIINFLTDTFKDSEKIKQINPIPASKKIISSFLNTKLLNIYIDDLDRGWQGKMHDVHKISALINSVRDIASENKGISFRIGLRSDVYFLYRTSDESTDKIEGSVIWLAWTNHEILFMLVKRIETFFGKHFDEAKLKEAEQQVLAGYLNNVMEPRFNGRGNWENIPMYRMLMSLIRKRPRDLVKLCTLAAKDAYKYGLNKITPKNFDNIFSDYSLGRLQDTINEYRSELPDIERLLLGMRPSRVEKFAKTQFLYNSAGLLKKINNVIQSGKFNFANGHTANEKELASFMYKINFLTARKEKLNKQKEITDIDRKYFEENRYLYSPFADFGYDWEIHPAYRWALQPEDINSIFSSLRNY